jgi:DNA (cytosine-5)-methyltransferase 1
VSQLGFEETIERADLERLTMADVEARTKNGLVAVGSFSGCGGSSLGLRLAGWSVPYAIEFIPEAAKTYQANAPTTFVDTRDIRKVDPEDVLRRLGLERGDLDLFEGSPPCASFSSAGKREKGWGEEKSYSDGEKQRTDDLFFEWMRILDGLYPRAFLAENVPGMMMGRALEEYTHKIIAELSELGYHVRAKVLNACWYGTPQLRERLIFVGLRRDVADYPFDFPAPTVDPPYTLRDALATVGELDPADVAAASMEKYAVGRAWKKITDARAEGREVRFETLPCERCGEPLVARTHEILKTTGNGVVTKATCADGAPAEIAKEYFMLVVPELDRPCPTVTATSAQTGAASVCHPTECRKFVQAELRAICGFPTDFALTGTREQQVERMGRAVPPPMYEVVGRAIAERLG